MALALPEARVFGGAATAKPISGRVIVLSGRFANDLGFIGIHFISEFSAGFLFQNGRDSEALRRFDRAAAARRNGVRTLGMASIMFNYSPSNPGYWKNQQRMVEEAASRGLYTELCLFADAQVVMPRHEDRKLLVRDYAQFCREMTSIVPQLSNEPAQNGWSGATDRELLELGDIFANAYGNKDFSIGDPPDETTTEGGEPLGGYLETLAKHCWILQIHDSRQEDNARYARWVDHLKGFTDYRDRVKGCVLWHDEPMGMAGVRDVPLPSGRTYRRENRADTLVAAACVAAITQTGFTTHYISEQNDEIPGLMESGIAADIPQGPQWRYINAGLGGSPVTGFSGWEKVRPCTNGVEAWAAAIGMTSGSITWDRGFVAECLYRTPHVEIWHAKR